MIDNENFNKNKNINENNLKIDLSKISKGTLLKIIGTFVGVLLTNIVALIIAIVQITNSSTSELNKKIIYIEKYIVELRKQNEYFNNKINEQSIIIDNTKRNLLFIYTRTELNSIDEWQDSIKEHKSSAENDLR